MTAPRARAGRPFARGEGAAPSALVRIRRAQLADARAIASVMRAAIRTLARGACAPRQLAAWSSLPPLYHAWAMTAGGERYLVAELGERIVAYGALRVGELTALFVLPRAARRGIGAALAKRLEHEARRRGVRRLTVRAALSAVGFYEAMGFRGSRSLRVPLPGGAALEARELVKRLSPSALPASLRLRAVRKAF